MSQQQQRQSIDLYGTFRQLQWLRIFRTVWYILDPQILFLAGLAMIAVGGIDLALESMFGDTATAAPAILQASSDPVWPWSEGWSITGNLHVAGPWLTLFDSVLGVTQFLTAPEAARRFLKLFGFVAIWSFFGGAICRMVALRFARDQSITVFQALRFSAKRCLTLIAPSVIVAAGVLFFWIFGVVGGWISCIPGGAWVTGVLMVIPLALGFMIAILVAAYLVAWPVFQASIAVEGSDGFDGFSRSLNLIFSRPAYYIWNWFVALLFSGWVLFVIGALLALIIHGTMWGFGAGSGTDRVLSILRYGPESLQDAFQDSAWYPTETAGGLATPDGLASEIATDAVVDRADWLASRWLYALASLVGTIGVAHFWSCATVIYFLIRKHEDSVELREIFLEGDSSDDSGDGPALAGVAAGPHDLPPRPVRPPGDNETTTDTTASAD